MHHVQSNLYATKAAALSSYGPTGHVKRSKIAAARQSRGPWLSGVLCCHTMSWLTMASSESVGPFLCLIFFVHWIFALRPRMGWYRQIPQFAPRIFNCVPSSVPRRSYQVHLVVSSLIIIAFAKSAVARQPHLHTRRFSCGRVTRLQSSLYATGLMLHR